LPKALTAWKRFCDDVDDELKGATPAAERTLRWYFDEHWSKMEKAIPSEKGRESVDEAMRVRILPHLGHLLLEKINDAEVGDFAAALRANGYAPDTINGALSTLRKFLRDAVAREVLDKYPIRRRLPRQKTEKLRLELTPEERRRFREAFDDEAGFRAALPDGRRFGVVVELKDGTMRGGPEGSAAAHYHFEHFRALKPLFVVALETGLSRGDLMGLRWTSVKDGWIRIARARTGEEAVVAISTACQEALEELKKRRVRSAEFVFVNEKGRPIPEKTLERTFATTKRLAKIERRFRFHDIRHTFRLDARLSGRLAPDHREGPRAHDDEDERAVSAARRGGGQEGGRGARPGESIARRELLALPGGRGGPERGRNPQTPPGLFGEPCWIRTSDPLLKRQVL